MDFKRYSDLLILQFKTQFNKKFLEIITQLFIEQVNNIILQFKIQLNIEQATVGNLDLIGDLIGLKRNFYKGIVLDDETYRFFLKMKITQNKCFYNCYDLKNFLYFYFKDDLRLVDNHNMSVDYYVKNLSPQILDVIKNYKNQVLSAPAGVLIEVITPMDENLVCFLDIKREEEIKPEQLLQVVFFNDVPNFDLIDGRLLDIDIIF